MGRKSKVQAGPGQVLIKQRTQAQMKERLTKATAKHNKPLESQIDIRDLDDVMEQVELAGKVFSAENPLAELLIAPETDVDALEASKEERRAEEALHASSLTIPRRPKWTASMTPQQLDLNERQSFLTWRRGLAALEDNEKLVLTPFEKNLDIWRQLWRVLERCDLVVMVVDARNPLFYRCPDLEAYVKELDPNRRTMLLLNKSDLLTRDARQKWATYLKEQGISYMFWSAKVATAKLEGKEIPELINVDGEDADDEDAVVLERDELLSRVQKMAEEIAETRRAAAQASLSKHLESHGSSLPKGKSETDAEVGTSNASGGRVMVGFVGYPNVGKSSTINALVGEKKTGVTSTPGKTKHFQTLIISDELMLCDCPGLVFPSFTTSRSEMVAAGVLPVDRMTDHRGPIQVVANKVPRAVFESTYGFTLPPPKPYENPNRPPTAAELLRAYAMSRRHVAGSGLPDETRASRAILKDYLSGKLLFCYAPPNEDQAGFSLRAGAQVEDEADDDDEDYEEVEEDSDDEYDEDEGEEDGEPSGSGSRGGKVIELGDSNMDDVFRDLDSLSIGAELRASKAKENQKEKAPHKMHRKAARKKDRSWRVTNDGSDGMPSSAVKQKAVSNGAANVRLSV